MRLPPRALPAAALSGLLALGTLAAGTPSAPAGTAAPPSVVVPHLDPVHVAPDGSFTVRLRNDGDQPVSVSLSALSGTSVLGNGLDDVDPSVAATPLLTLTPEGLDALTERTWMTVTVHLDVTDGAGRTVGLNRRVELVAPTVTTRAGANPSNPLAGRAWGSYQGSLEPSWAPAQKATGSAKAQLARVAFQPKARWFVAKLKPADFTRLVHRYVVESQAGDPDALVQLTMFTIGPWEGAACAKAPTAAQIARDRAYTAAFARGIGNAHAAVVVQIDGPDAACEPGGRKILAGLVGEAVHTLQALPNTSAYIDMGAADWHQGRTAEETALLLDENIAEARGFAMDVTHTDSVADEVVHAQKLVADLAAHGVPGKHAVIDTSDNGTPFTGKQYHVQHPHQGTWAAASCPTPTSKLCVSLGIPPTSDVANPRWGLTAAQNRAAAKYVDGYLWIKRPWLAVEHGHPFDQTRALQEVAASPYFS